MLLGFISLLLTVTQGFISKFCVKEDVLMHMLPCSKHEAESSKHKNVTTTEHFQSFLPIVGTTRRLLAEHAAAEAGYCGQKVDSNTPHNCLFRCFLAHHFLLIFFRVKYRCFPLRRCTIYISSSSSSPFLMWHSVLSLWFLEAPGWAQNRIVFVNLMSVSLMSVVVLFMFTMLMQIHQWKKWEDALADENFDTEAGT